MNKIISIDLGTTYSCVAFESMVIVNEMGNRITPSCVYINNDQILVGEVAKEQKGHIYGVKRLMGKKYSEIDVTEYNYKITSDKNGDILIEDKYTPEDISSFILSYLKGIAKNYFGYEVNKAIITIPAYFNNDQRQATIKSATLAGLEVIQLLHEPTAGALANGCKKDGLIIVFDLGGGTLDVTLLHIEDDVYQVKGTSGNMKLGGEDIDYILSQHYNISKDESERVKKTLSSITVTTVETTDGEKEITRYKFEELIGEFVEKCLIPIKDVLEMTKIKKEEINDIVLLGGTTRIPLVREMLTNYFDKELNTSNNPDENVAIGASIHANTLNDVILLDAVSISIGVEVADGKMVNIIPRGTQIPITKEKMFMPYSQNQPSINIKIYEGENIIAKNNVYLGNITLDNLNANSQIKVFFTIDISGIITASCVDINSKNKKVSKLIINK